MKSNPFIVSHILPLSLHIFSLGIFAKPINHASLPDRGAFLYLRPSGFPTHSPADTSHAGLFDSKSAPLFRFWAFIWTFVTLNQQRNVRQRQETKEADREFHEPSPELGMHVNHSVTRMSQPCVQLQEFGGPSGILVFLLKCNNKSVAEGPDARKYSKWTKRRT